ncbi:MULTISPECIES: mechanosensitive ion channel family protein [unclassified Streptomyces]|uniref:mechanosensitive ion channel family protein n=1 Tax=unclassified Streptomyces TaxID=2593676 RepID=UPI003450E0C2
MATTLAVNFTQGLNDAWSKVAQFVPKLVGFLVILVIGWFVSKMIARVLDRVLRKVGSENLSERAGTARMLRDSKYDMTGIVCKIVYYALMLITLQLALGVFGTNPVSTMINGIVAWLPRGIVAVVLVVVAMAIANAVRGIVGSALSSMSYGRMLATIVWACIVALGVIAALGQAGIATTVTQPVLYAALATAAGILIVGVGGGMIAPMRQRMERMLTAAERETTNAKGSLTAYQSGREDAMTNQPVRERTDLGTDRGRDLGTDGRRDMPGSSGM